MRGSTLVRAIGGVFEKKDCAASGKVCSLASRADGFDCLPAPGCGDVTLEGFCDGNRKIWCSAGAPKSIDCNLAGKICGHANDSRGIDCIAP